MREEWFVPAGQSKEFAQNKSKRNKEQTKKQSLKLVVLDRLQYLKDFSRAEQNWLVSELQG